MDKVSAREGLICEVTGDETVIFDPVANVAHSLDSAASRVWRALDSAATPAEIATASGLSESQVLGTLERLAAIDVVEVTGVSRRAALRRLAIAGAVAAELPAIVSLAIPEAAHAASGSASSISTSL